MKLTKILDSKRAFWIVFGVLAVIQMVLSSCPRPSPPARAPDNVTSVDTFIPEGYQLVPIRISNQDELASLIDRYALVDVYSAGNTVPVLQAVRLIRAPNNPSVFAVLVPQGNSGKLLSGDLNFHIVLRNPKQSAVAKKTKPRRIIWEGP